MLMILHAQGAHVKPCANVFQAHGNHCLCRDPQLHPRCIVYIVRLVVNGEKVAEKYYISVVHEQMPSCDCLGEMVRMARSCCCYSRLPSMHGVV